MFLHSRELLSHGFFTQIKYINYLLGDCCSGGDAGRGLLGPVWLLTLLGSRGGVSSFWLVLFLEESSVVCWLVGFGGKTEAALSDDITGKLELELVLLISVLNGLCASDPESKDKHKI